VKFLVDEMYPPALAQGLRGAGIDAVSVLELKPGGSSDAEVFGAAVVSGRAVLTENVGDFVPIAAEHSTAGGHHAGVLIVLSSRFSRRPAGIEPLIAAIRAIENQLLADRVVYLERMTAE
jgi:predicted nuclease of predicted toxin-antitoxin system